MTILKSLDCKDKHLSNKASKLDHRVCDLPLPAGLQPWSGEQQESVKVLMWITLSTIVKPLCHIQAQH